MTSAPFSTKLPDFQVVWDSTSLGWLKTCPTLYRYQMLEQWTRKSKGIHLMFGQLYASGMETYAKEVANGLSHDAATVAMVRHVLALAGERVDGVWIPWDPGDHPDAKIKNRYTLVRSLVWNVEDNLGSPYRAVIKSNGRPAVEESFNFYAFDVDEEAIHLAGHLDGIVEHTHTGERFVRDDKTTKAALNRAYFNRYTPDNQMSLYTAAGKVILNAPVAGVLVRAAQILVEGTRFAIHLVPRSPQVMDEWLDDTKFWIGQAQSFAKADYWPHNDKSCGSYGGCPFQEVCARSPAHREAWLREDFTRHEWNPLQARSE